MLNNARHQSLAGRGAAEIDRASAELQEGIASIADRRQVGPARPAAPDRPHRSRRHAARRLPGGCASNTDASSFGASFSCCRRCCSSRYSSTARCCGRSASASPHTTWCPAALRRARKLPKPGRRPDLQRGARQHARLHRRLDGADHRVGLALALAINTRVPGARQCMTMMFLTNLMPIIAVCLVWRFLFHPYGLVNQLLALVGFGRIDWLTGADTAMPAIIIVTVWRFAPISWSCSSPGCWPSPRTTTKRRNGRLQRFAPIPVHHAAAAGADICFVVVVSRCCAPEYS